MERELLDKFYDCYMNTLSEIVNKKINKYDAETDDFVDDKSKSIMDGIKIAQAVSELERLNKSSILVNIVYYLILNQYHLLTEEEQTDVDEWIKKWKEEINNN